MCRDARGAWTGRGAPTVNLNEGASQKPGEKGLTRAPTQPPREVEREREREKERERQTKAKNREQG